MCCCKSLMVNVLVFGVFVFSMCDGIVVISYCVVVVLGIGLVVMCRLIIVMFDVLVVSISCCVVVRLMFGVCF